MWPLSLRYAAGLMLVMVRSWDGLSGGRGPLVAGGRSPGNAYWGPHITGKKQKPRPPWPRLPTQSPITLTYWGRTGKPY